MATRDKEPSTNALTIAHFPPPNQTIQGQPDDVLFNFPFGYPGRGLSPVGFPRKLELQEMRPPIKSHTEGCMAGFAELICH